MSPQNMDVTVALYNHVRETILDVEYPLIYEQIQAIDAELEKAITELNWTSEGAWEYIQVSGLHARTKEASSHSQTHVSMGLGLANPQTHVSIGLGLANPQTHVSVGSGLANPQTHVSIGSGLANPQTHVSIGPGLANPQTHVSIGPGLANPQTHVSIGPGLAN